MSSYFTLSYVFCFIRDALNRTGNEICSFLFFAFSAILKDLARKSEINNDKVAFVRYYSSAHHNNVTDNKETPYKISSDAIYQVLFRRDRNNEIGAFTSYYSFVICARKSLVFACLLKKFRI